MDFHCIVYVFNNISDNTDHNGKSWYTNLFYQFSKQFHDMKLTFDGNVKEYRITSPPTLENFILLEDIANLAMLAYEESIKHH